MHDFHNLVSIPSHEEKGLVHVLYKQILGFSSGFWEANPCDLGKLVAAVTLSGQKGLTLLHDKGPMY